VKSSAVDANHDPGTWQQDVGLLKLFDVLVSDYAYQLLLHVR
jgi:hypothetical protein